METMTLWFVQEKGWVDIDHQDDWYVAAGPFVDDADAQNALRARAGLGRYEDWWDPERYRLVTSALSFEVVES